jgi:hypothetical protein
VTPKTYKNLSIRWVFKFLENDCKLSSSKIYHRRDDCPGMDAYKRVQEFAAKQYEFTPKVLTPAIFQKTLQLPPTLNQANKIPCSKPDQGQTLAKPAQGSCSKTKVV